MTCWEKSTNRKNLPRTQWARLRCVDSRWLVQWCIIRCSKNWACHLLRLVGGGTKCWQYQQNASENTAWREEENSGRYRESDLSDGTSAGPQPQAHGQHTQTCLTAIDRKSVFWRGCKTEWHFIQIIVFWLFLQIEEMVQRNLNIYTKTKTDSDPKDKGDVRLFRCFENCKFLFCSIFPSTLIG